LKSLCLFVGSSTVIVVLVLFAAKDAVAVCTPDMLEDWPDTPCGPIQLPQEKQRDYWQGYYKFKGKEWMEEKRTEMEKAILSDTLEQWRSSMSNYNVWLYYKITNNVSEVPPLKQFKSGVPVNEIKCKENYVLVLKSSNQRPACITYHSRSKLVNHGWQDNNPFLADKNGKVDLSKINLPPTKYGGIDYGKIGYLVSENQFKKMLADKNIEYSSGNLSFIEGLSLTSDPPYTDYCGYVVSSGKQDYWFWSSFYNDTLTSAKFYNENPDPCKPNYDSCTCTLQRQLAEKNLKELSYLTDSEEQIIGKSLQRYLSETPVSNVSDKFVVGKYNFESPNTIPYCGKFVDDNQDVYFQGYIQKDNIMAFELAFEKPKLCAISDDAGIFDFVKPPISK